jgi:uncharacterized protein YgiM (DUF1202 family)
MDQPAMGPSTPVHQFVLRISVIALSLAVALPGRAQSRVVTTPAAVLSSPSGKAVGSIHPGTTVRVIETRGAYAKVTIDGFVERARLSAQRGNASPRVGNRAAVVRARGATTAKSVASLDAGTTVAVASGNAPTGWAKVSRDGWILKSSLDRASSETARSSNSGGRTTASAKSSGAARKASGGEVAASARPPQGSTPSGPVHAGATSTAPVARGPVADSALTPTGNIALRAAPDAKALATVVQGATLTPLARDRGWVRVRLEGWVPERDVAPADTSIRTGVSAADLRADPVGNRGKLVRWSVQILARQKADVLRKDLAPDETYLLARGPYEENALLYLVVPPSLLVMTKSIPELSQAMITARVRTGRSDLVGVPILDLLTINPRK